MTINPMTKFVKSNKRGPNCLAVTKKADAIQDFFFFLSLLFLIIFGAFTRRCVISQLECWHCCWILLFVWTDVTVLMFIRNDHQSPPPPHPLSLPLPLERKSFLNMTCIEFF